MAATSRAINDFGTITIEGFKSETLVDELKKTDGHTARSRSMSLTSVYLGETIKYEVILRRNRHLDHGLWMKCISTVSCRATLQSSTPKLTSDIDLELGLNGASKFGTTESSSRVTDTSALLGGNVNASSENGLICPVQATFVGNANSVSLEQEADTKPYFRDNDTFVIPMSSNLQVQDVATNCRIILLQVSLWMYTVRTLELSPLEEKCDHSYEKNGGMHGENVMSHTQESIMAGSGREDEVVAEGHGAGGGDADGRCDDVVPKSRTHVSIDLESPVQVSSSHHTAWEQTASVRLWVQGPPELRLRHSAAGLKHLILLSVRNRTEKAMVIKNVQMLSSSTPVHDAGGMDTDVSPVLWESCYQLISLECPRQHPTFPITLNPCEDFGLIYRLRLCSIPSDSELSLGANVKWTHAGAQGEVTTVYRLPKIKVRCPPFTVTLSCDDDVKIDNTFFVTCTISNQLHDFMSTRLYYNLDYMQCSTADQADTDGGMDRVKQLKESILCHDPDIALSACLRGSSLPIRVGFLIHRPGLYELSELMKVNVHYALPDTQQQQQQQSAPLAREESLSSCSDLASSLDEKEQASEELWGWRSGSTASLATPSGFHTAAERRRSFASKSYSFGDLAPTLSADSDASGHLRLLKRSSVVPPRRPPPPRVLSQTERDLVRPSNFLKNPFYIYARDPFTQ